MRMMHVSSGRNKKASDTAVSLSVPPTPAVAGATCGGVPSICTRPSLAGTASHLGKITSDVAFFSMGQRASSHCQSMVSRLTTVFELSETPTTLATDDCASFLSCRSPQHTKYVKRTCKNSMCVLQGKEQPGLALPTLSLIIALWSRGGGAYCRTIAGGTEAELRATAGCVQHVKITILQTHPRED